MEKVIQVLNRMQADGVVEKYAIGGGIAFVRYLEPYETDDIDVFISPVTVGQMGLVSLEPIYTYLKNLGYEAVKEGVVVEGWLVQFVPAFNSLQEEAVEKAHRVPFGKEYTYLFSAEHLAAELLRSGRPHDHARTVALVESDQMEMKAFREIINRHGLAKIWKKFVIRFELEEHE